jgi:hypothetical protein
MVRPRRMRWATDVVRVGEKRHSYVVLVGKPEEMRPAGRRRRRWIHSIKMDLKGNRGVMDWIHLA